MVEWPQCRALERSKPSYSSRRKLDEPTVYLNVFTRQELSRELGTTILLTTHNLKEAELLCGRVMLFNKRKIAERTPKELIEKVGALKAERKNHRQD